MQTPAQSAALPGRGPADYRSVLFALAATVALVTWYLVSAYAMPAAETILVPVLFAVLGIALRGVTRLGGMTGLGYAFLFYAIAGRQGFSVLFFLFILTLAATRLGERKRGERRPVPRDPAQVAANLFVAGCLLVQADTRSDPFYALAALAALAELTADTVSSEIGSAFGGTTRTIWGFKTCAPGSQGGVSVVGTAAGILGSGSIVSLTLFLFNAFRWADAAVLVTVAMLGTFVDSIAGATLERRGWIGNNLVNLIGTGSAALFLWLYVRVYDWLS